MSRLFLLMFFLLQSLIWGFERDYSMVFVHIGDTLPTYLPTALNQAATFNPDADLILVANQQAVEKAKNTLTMHDNFTIVTCEDLKKSQEHTFFQLIPSLDRRYRGGFWHFAVERFFYIEDLMRKYQLKHVFHMESDVMVYFDLSEILPVMEKEYPGIAATLDNDERAIAGFIYFNNQKVARSLISFMLMSSNKKLNDMELIALYKQSNEGHNLRHLPIIPPSYASKYPLQSPMGHQVVDKGVFSNNFTEFNSIFDAAAIGQYLGGIDPRNGPSAPGFINESAIFNPGHFEYVWKKDHKGRQIPYLKFEKELVRINNLHIHSKLLESFSSLSQSHVANSRE